MRSTDLFSNIEHDLVFVTGPHRSGTTICARMIAADTGYDLIVEDEFNCSSLTQLAALLQYNGSSKVIQCPFLSSVIHDLSYLIDVNMSKALIVWMKRDEQDIIESELRAERVGFDKVALGQRAKYRVNTDRHISQIKAEAWQDQKAVIPHTMEIEYESLHFHELWIDSHKDLPFQHDINTTMPKVFDDALRAVTQN